MKTQIILIWIILLISLTACSKTKYIYLKTPPEIIIQKEYVKNDISIPKFDNCSVYTSDIVFKATVLDNVTIYYLNTKNAIKLINIEQNRIDCLKQYKKYIEMICSFDSIICK